MPTVNPFPDRLQINSRDFMGTTTLYTTLSVWVEYTIYKNNFAAPLFSLVATATKASRRPMPESRADESLKTLVRGSCSGWPG